MIWISGFQIVSRWIMFTLLLLISSSATERNAAKPLPVTETSWELLESAEGVKIYFRWVNLTDKIKVRERKAEIMIHNSLENALKAITDDKEIPLWMSGVKKVMTLHRDSPSKWYTYSLYGLPWPFNDRELITLNTLTRSTKKDKIFLNLHSSDESYPAARGVERLSHYKASWELFEVNSGLVKMTFIARSEDPPAFPRCVQDPVIKKIFHNNMVSLKKLLDPEVESK